MDAEAERATTPASPILTGLAIAYVLGVLAITLLPAPWPAATAESPGGVLSIANWLDPDTWTHGSVPEFALNILLFVPIGLIAVRFLRSWWLRILGPLALTFMIESLQLPLPDRISDPRDIVANMVGALIGILAMWVVLAYRRDRESDPDRVALH